MSKEKSQNDKKKIRTTLSKFIGVNDCHTEKIDWNFIMLVIEKIEGIIEFPVDVNGAINIHWWYSPKKTVTFRGGMDDVSWTKKRKPFDTNGKSYDINCYYKKEQHFTIKHSVSETKLEAAILACYRWVNWYNRRKK